MCSPDGPAADYPGRYGSGEDDHAGIVSGAAAPSGPPGVPGPSSVAGALSMLGAALDYLNAADAAGLGTTTQAECLIALERAEARHAAARAKILAVFTASGGCTADGQYGPKPWLRYVTRITRGAAAGAVGWARRLDAHPAVAGALAAGEVSASWAREICGWSDKLPEDKRGDADEILLGAAAAGAAFEDLAALAAEMYGRSRSGRPDPDTLGSGDGDNGFEDRQVRLDTTFGGAGCLDGDLTPGCAAALAAVLDSLGATAGPEDTRTVGQRHHDALQEACHRLIASGMLPERAGQPVQVQVNIPLSALRDMPGAADAEAAWAAARAAAAGTGGKPGVCWLSGAEAEAACCDATTVPVVTGHVDPAALDRMAQAFPGGHIPATSTGNAAATAGRAHGGDGSPGTDMSDDATTSQDAGPPATTDITDPGSATVTADPADPAGSLPPGTRWRLSQALLRLAADALSGSGGLAAHLRARLPGQVLTTASLPLDVGEAAPTIPGHLRRAVILRDRHCRFPGCDQPPSVCQVHHLTPRADGGPTSLPNLCLLCRFHHLIVIHKWGWTLAIHPDGTATATSPHGRTLHSHAPPGEAA